MSLLRNTVKSFLANRINGPSSLILGWSGGRDSMVLFDALCRIKEEISFDLHLAHLDHGWRQESAQEAAFLSDLAERLGLPFHHKRLETRELQGNLEAIGRKARYDFFREVSEQVGAQAVLLAHHADDQAETALKGVLQGNALPFVGGMKKESVISQVTIWRPLLEVPKVVIEGYLAKNNIDAFDDKTNYDSRFLRARMRQSIIPKLSQEFGKEVSLPLGRLAQESLELRDYLDAQVEKALGLQIQGPFGSQLPVDPNMPSVEMRHLVRRFCGQRELILSAEQVERVCELLKSGVANRSLAKGGCTLYIDRSRLFMISVPLEKIKWQMSVHEAAADMGFQSVDWISLWQEGVAWAFLPEKKYFLDRAVMNEPYHKKSSISKWWNDHKIPAFLRAAVPVLCDNGGPQHEFLTGRCWYDDKSAPAVRVKIEALLL